MATADPFEADAVRERINNGLLLILLAAFLCGLAYLEFGLVLTHGTPIKAEVVRVATYPAGRVAGGDLPILTVRLPDGSTREVLATWPDVDNCAPGGWISLVQQGRALQVGRPGCNNAQ